MWAARLLLLLACGLAPAAADWAETRAQFDALWVEDDPDKKIAALAVLRDAGGDKAADKLVELLAEVESLKPPKAISGRIKAIEKEQKAVLAKGLASRKVGGRLERYYKQEALDRHRELMAELLPLKQKLGRLLDLRNYVIDALARMSDEVGLAQLEGKADDKRPQVASAVLLVLGRTGRASARGPVRARVGDKAPEVAAAAISAAAALGDREALALIQRRLDDKRWQVRAAAINALGRLHDVSSLALLVGRLRKEQGRLVDDIEGALEQLTGVNHGEDVAAWRAWLEANQGKLAELVAEAPRRREAELEARRKLASERAKTGSRSVFYGIGSRSLRVCFVIDISASMEAPARLDRSQVATPARASYPANPTKLQVCQAELIHAIQQLPSHAKFNVVYYHTFVERYRASGMVSASASEKKTCIRWVKKLRATGGTNIYEALRAAFTLGDERPETAAKLSADTIYFMTDGAPSTGPTKDLAEIAGAVAQWNASQQVVIHTIAVASQVNAWLQRLAAANGGTTITQGEYVPEEK